MKDEAPSVTELLIRLGRDVSVLVFCETHLAAARNLPEAGARPVTSPVR